MNRTALILGTVFVVPLVVFLALGFRSDPSLLDSPLVGTSAPSFILTDLEGNTVALADFAGKPVVLNFWATWCQPCIVEHPVLMEGSRRYEGRVAFLGVVYQDEPPLIRSFVRARGGWGPTLIDSGNKIAIAYGVYGAPETFFIDRDGTITEKYTGAISGRKLVQTLDALL